ncbi:hypothetical protein JCM11641_006494 [Rhodosporidiobolus odoratus]
MLDLVQPTPTYPQTVSLDRDATPAHPTLPIELHSFVVFGGGTGCNHVLSAFQGKKTTFVVPVSDDGGSSSEVQRVLGGPALGDLRSRLIRLIPPSPPDSPLDCIRRLLEYRLPGSNVSSRDVKSEWQEVVEGSHKLWRGIPGDRKETIRAFLVHFESAVLKKAQRVRREFLFPPFLYYRSSWPGVISSSPDGGSFALFCFSTLSPVTSPPPPIPIHPDHQNFSYRRASIGNLFLAGTSLFLGSIPSAIFLFASLTSIDLSRFSVLPVINTSEKVTIAAELEDGTVLAGQSEISHPSATPPIAQKDVQGEKGEGGARLKAPGSLSGAQGGGGYFPLTRATTPSFPDPPILGAEEDDFLSSFSAPSPPPVTNSTFSPLSMSTPIAPPTLSNPRGAGQPTPTSTSTPTFSTNLEFTKHASSIPPLSSRIKRVFYLNAFGSEIYPRPNGLVGEALKAATCIIYAPGSLYTSILPCLELRPLGGLLSRSRPHSPSFSSPATATDQTQPYKVLLLNSLHDRETPSPHYTALEFAKAIRDACERSCGVGDAGANGAEGESGERRRLRERDVISHLVYLRGGEVEVDEGALRNLGIVPVPTGPTSTGLFDDEVVKEALTRILTSQV